MQEFSARSKSDLRSKIELLTPLYLIKKHILEKREKNKDMVDDDSDNGAYSVPSIRPFMGKIGIKATENLSEEEQTKFPESFEGDK
jgi:hypothetical protein